MGGNGGGGLRWLVVDDDPMLLAQLGKQLRARGDDVVVASAPLHALWILERTTVDAVLCDFALASGDDGPNLLDTVAERWPDTTRIMMTGWDDRRESAERCRAAQATFFKPLDVGELEDAARKLRQLRES